ncbi:unnamed protein product, partial [Ceratitis capitata]
VDNGDIDESKAKTGSCAVPYSMRVYFNTLMRQRALIYVFTMLTECVDLAPLNGC